MSCSTHFHSLGTVREHQTKDEAAADLASMITFLCEHESTEVKIASVRGRVGVFSCDLYGGIVTRHIWPEGRVSQYSGPGTPGEAEAGFRNHVAQITWDVTLAASDILSEAQPGEFRWWCEFERKLSGVFGLRSEDDLRPPCPSKTMVFRHLPRSSTNCPLLLERPPRQLAVCARRSGQQLQADQRA